MKKETPKFVKFGNGGDVVYYSANCTSSGYGTPERPHAAKDIPDGVPALDIRPALETDAGYSWVFKGPMLNPDLPDNAVDRCPQPSAFFAAGLHESFQTLLLIHESTAKETAGALDCVSISEFVAGWVKLGAKFGHYKNGFPVWE